MPQLSIQQIVEESKKDEPILLIALSGIDPSKELKDYAQNKIGLTKYIEVSSHFERTVLKYHLLFFILY